MAEKKQLQTNTAKTKKQPKKPPHILVILFCMVIFAALITYLVPAAMNDK